MNNLTTTNSQLPADFDLEHYYTRTLTEETRRTYMSTIREFFSVDSINDITVERLQSVTPYIANDWANKLFVEGLAPATINKKLSSLQNFYNFLCRRTVGVMSYNPFSTNEGCIRFKNASKNYSDKRALSPDEVKNVFESVEFPEDKHSNKYLLALRDLIVLELLATTGMRRSEITSINIGDIKTTFGRYIVNITGKGDKTRPMVIAKSIKKHIDEYIELRGLTYDNTDLPLITNHTSNREDNIPVNEVTIYRIVKKYADKAGIGVDDVSPHNFRHTFCTSSIDMGIDIHSVQDLMGHSSVATTRRYEHLYRTIKDSPSDALSELYGI